MDKEREKFEEKVEMAQHLAKWLCRPEGCGECEFWNDNVGFDMCCDFENPLKIAEELQKAGYGDTKQAVREFADRVKELIHKADYIEGYAEIGLCEEIDEAYDELLAEATGELMSIKSIYGHN